MTTHHANPLVQDHSSELPGPALLPEGMLTIDRLVGRHDRGWRRPLATLLGPVLDRRLAAGVPPESGRLLSARAERLVSTSGRRKVVREWEGVLEHALAAPRTRPVHAPLCRDRLLASVGDLGAMLSALSIPHPVSARGVAMASQLIGDGTGPLFNRNCTVTLSEALRAVTTQLDPASGSTGTSANRL
jgi:hypothetical protein